MTAHKKDEAIIAFDLDGTLVDSASDLARALNAALSQHGYPPHEVEQVRGFIGDGARKLVERALPGWPPPVGAVDVVLASFREQYRRALVVDTRPYPGIADALRALKDRAPRARHGGFGRDPGDIGAPRAAKTPAALLETLTRMLTPSL